MQLLNPPSDHITRQQFMIQINQLYISYSQKLRMKVLVLLLLLAVVSSDRFFYLRVLDCINYNTKGCVNWKESTTLSYRTYLSSYFCLSRNSYVRTPDGPKSMKELTVGDKVWGYDPKTGNQNFSKLSAWLHRDPYGIINYDLIQTNQDTQFQASDFHNVGFVNQQHKIDFKFFQDLTQGDQLMGFPGANPIVKKEQKQVERQGLYSPFTQFGNYYVYNTSESGQAPSANDPMILVHALSQINHPQSQLGKAEKVLHFWSLLGLNQQPKDDQIYVHPLYRNFNWLFGSNWRQVEREVKYSVNRHFQALPTPSPNNYNNNYNKNSNSNYNSNSNSNFNTNYEWSPFASSYCYGSSSSKYNCEQQRQNKMKALGLSVSIVQQVPLL